MKKSNPLPPFIEMFPGDYESFIEKNTIRVYREFIEPDRKYENGVQTDYSLDCCIDIRVSPDSHGRLYVYSHFSGRLWSTEELDEANLILKKELKYCNKFMRDINEGERKESIEKFMKQTEPALISTQEIISNKN